MTAESEQARPLPIRLVVERGFRFAWESRAILVGPYAIFASLTILTSILGGLLQQSADSAVGFGITAAEEVFALSLAVGIHRFVLVAETPSATGFFHLDRNFIRYLMNALTLFVSAFLAVMLVMVTLGVGNGDAAASANPNGLGALIALALLPLAAVALSRLSLMLPAAALGEPVPMSAIWRRTSGNGLRLLATSLISLAPFMIVDGVLLEVDQAISDAARFGVADAVIAILIGLISSAQLIVVTIVLSLQYDALIRGGGPQRDAPPRPAA
jgi:hypothetical protein